MIIIVYGDDTFRGAEKVRQLKQAFIQKHDASGMNTDSFPREGERVLVGDVLQSACSYPFLGDKRMVIVRDAIFSATKDEIEMWRDGASRMPESTILVFWETAEPKALERKPLFKTLKDGTELHLYAFPELQGAELVRWVTLRVKQNGGSIHFQAVRALQEQVGADLWQLSGEIEKLVAFAGGSEITESMVRELVRASFESQIFALIDAVSRKQSGEALRLLREERWSGANDFYLMTMLARQVRILLAARALLDENPYATKQQLVDVMGVHPFVAQKALAQAKGFERESLIKAHELLFQFDQGMKSGKLRADMAVDLIAGELLQNAS